MNILVIARVDHNNIAGHMVSTATIANGLYKNGHKVHVATNTHNITINYFNPKIIMHHISFYNKYLEYISSGKYYYRLSLENNIHLAIILDKASAYHYSFISTMLKIPMIPIIAGGGYLGMRPLSHNLTIVFTEENRDNLKKIYRWKRKIKIIPSRVDPTRYFPIEIEKFNDKDIKIAFISRIHYQKWIGFKSFINELSDVMKIYRHGQIIVDIYGDGSDVNKWCNYIKEKEFNDNVTFTFQGSIILDALIISKYSMVVTQGRGVLEAIMCGVPTAISGENGYMGVVTEENIGEFAKTNFTGRKLLMYTKLLDDLNNIVAYRTHYRVSLTKYVRNNFSIEKMISEIFDILNSGDINLVAGEGNLLLTLLNNIRATSSATRIFLSAKGNAYMKSE
jgi:glycosyltransferase involved in cell wall biosynthesis